MMGFANATGKSVVKSRTILEFLRPCVQLAGILPYLYREPKTTKTYKIR